MWRPFLTVTLLASVLMTLTACGPSSAGRQQQLVLSALPGGCEEEFNRLVQIRESARPYSKEDVIGLIVRLDQSQKAKSRCGRMLVARLKALAGVR